MTTENWIDLNDIQAVAIAQSEGWEIESERASGWEPWFGEAWYRTVKWRGRPRQPKMKEVKMLCYFTSDELVWLPQELQALQSWIRQPHLDMIAKVPDET